MPEWLQNTDISLLTALREALCSPWLDKPMAFISSLGDKGMIWIAIGVIMLIIGLKNHGKQNWGLMLLLALGTNALATNAIIKPLVCRIRPYELLGYDILVEPLSDPSFPSGHTSAAFAAAAVIYAMDKRWGAAAYVFAFVMGVSRLYLGVHFPSDVLVGAVIGFLAGSAVIFAYKRLMLKGRI